MSFPANRSAALTSVQRPLSKLGEDVFFLDLSLRDSGGRMLSANRYAFTRTDNLAPLLAAAPTTLDIHREVSGDEWAITVTNTGGQTALFVWLADGRALGSEGFVYFSENYVCLFPGESRAITALWHGGVERDRVLEVRGWNTGEAQQI
jgi:hypothetical protein